MSYVDPIIEAFGGVRPLAAAIGKPPSTVQSWKARGTIPDSNKAEVLACAETRSIAIGPEDFFPHDKKTEATQ